MLWITGIVILFRRKHLMRISGKKFTFPWWAAYGLFVLGVWSLVYAPLPFGLGSVGQLVANLLGWALGMLGNLFGISGAIIAAALLLIIIVAAVVDLKQDKNPDAAAKTAAFAIPVLGLIAGGLLATKLVGAVNTVANATPDFVMRLLS